MPNPGDIYYALDTNKTYVTVDGQWVLQSPEFTGDINIPQATTVATLATVNLSPGTYGDPNTVPVITVDGKGRVTTAYSVPINIPAPAAAGVTGSVQFNDGGFLDGDASFTYSTTNTTLTFDNGQINGVLAFANPVPTFTNLSPLTSKGDILTHDGTINTREPVGPDGYVLSADSTTATGLRWIAGPGVGGSNVPYYVPNGITYFLPVNYQANFVLPIELDSTGYLDIEGYLIELKDQ